jgi:hypothetical protein
VRTLLSIGLMGLAVSPLFAQSSAIIDLNAKPRQFSRADFDALVACTLEKHPSETRRYARYHLERRDMQSWQENEKDPDSKLLMPAMKGCIAFADGEQIPFSLESLIFRWAAAHNIRKGY